MFKINLIPEVKQQQQKLKRLNIIVTSVAVVAAITLGTIVLLLTLYYLGKKVQVTSLDGKIDKLNEELVVYRDLEETVVSLETGLREIESIIDQDSKWLALFADIEKATPSDVRFKSLSVDASDQLTMDIEGKDIKSIDRFIKSFSSYKKDGEILFTTVQVDGYSVVDGSGKVSFQAKMSLAGSPTVTESMGGGQ